MCLVVSRRSGSNLADALLTWQGLTLAATGGYDCFSRLMYCCRMLYVLTHSADTVRTTLCALRTPIEFHIHNNKQTLTAPGANKLQPQHRWRCTHTVADTWVHSAETVIAPTWHGAWHWVTVLDDMLPSSRAGHCAVTTFSNNCCPQVSRYSCSWPHSTTGSCSLLQANVDDNGDEKPPHTTCPSLSMNPATYCSVPSTIVAESFTSVRPLKRAWMT